MPGTIDLVVAGLIAIVYPIWDNLSATPRMVRTAASGRPNARLPVYRELIAVQWTLSAVIAATWVHGARPWGPIGLVPPAGWRLVLAVAVLLAAWMFLAAQVRAIRRLDPARRERVRASLTGASPLIPQTQAERAWFVAVAITAGLCEEFMFRGYLLWAFRPWLGIWGAALASTVSFASVHAYLGRRGAFTAATLGAIFAVFTIATGSIIPAMALHVLVDLVNGKAVSKIFTAGSTSPVAA